MKVLLIDGNSFCYRAFYAIRELRNSKGEPTNAVYGFITMLEKLLKEVKPDGIAATFDLKGPTFRHKKYEDYKIHRKPMPDELIFQMPIIKEVLAAMNVPIFEKEGFEADDVMATLARHLEKAGHEPFIVTCDKDALQLVNKKIKVLNPMKDNFIYDEKAVKERYGVPPVKIVEIMALMGDASDNIPGVPGIGEKTASKLIIDMGSLDQIYKNISKVSGEKVREALIKYQDQARLSRELAVIDDKVPLEVDLKALKLNEPDMEKLGAIYKRLEFRTLLKGMPATEEKNQDDPKLAYHLVEDKKDFNELVKLLSGKKEWVFDFETTHKDPLKACPVGISFSFKEKEAYYVKFEGDPWKTGTGTGDLFASKNLTSTALPMGVENCLKKLKPLFEDEKISKVGQNIKYEELILKNFGIELAGISFDTMVASYVLNPAKPNHNLDDIAMEQLGIRITSIDELIGTGKNQLTMDQVDIEKVYRYGCQDSDVTYRIAKLLRPKLKEKESLELFEDIEMPLVPVLARMEFEGIAVDKKLLTDLSAEMEKSLNTLTKNIHQQAGEVFNINSPKQLAQILFVNLKLPVVKKTKTGPSTDVEVLQELSEIHPLPKEILKFRELSKLKSTYVDALPLLVNPRTGRVHTSFNQTVTATGRLSSSEPNLQNIPVRTEEGRKIRRAFVVDSKDSVLVSADYSQIELRILAHLSGDENLIRAFKEGADIHRHTASLIFDVTLDDVTDDMRDSAKTVNFGILYGMGPFSLAKSLNISNEAARDFIKQYFDRYPRVKRYLDGSMEDARKNGFVATLFKRRRYIPEIASKDPRTKAFAERTAINAPIQGTASDIIKIAMIQIDKELEKNKFLSKMILQVHDELLFETPKNELKQVLKLVTNRMQSAAKLQVPLKVSIKYGPNWLDMKEDG